MSLVYETIEAAVLGDEGAGNEVLIEYEPYMLFLSIVVRRDETASKKRSFLKMLFRLCGRS